MMKKCRQKNYHLYIDKYIDGVRDGSIISNDDIKAAMDYTEYKLNNPDVFIDSEKIDKAVELIERYFQVSLFDWELFIIACIHCYYKSTDTVVFDQYLIEMGRGNGKNGFISPVAWYLTTHYHGVREYNIDIVANGQDQASTSFDDVYGVLERTWSKSKKFFYKTKEIIQNLKTKSTIKYNTSNARTKDGKRTACLIFDEIHEYENYDLINVFTSGFGKKKHSRAFYITTNGYVREGVLDDMLAIAKDILNGTIKNLGMLPLLYHIESEEEGLNPQMWHKANPSLKYLPTLQVELEKNLVELQYKPNIKKEFYTKRMNWPMAKTALPVTEWKNIEATNREIPNLRGRTATVGIDYMKVNDFASVNIHIRDGNDRYDISHSWLCLKSADLIRLKIPWNQWAEDEHLTLVDEVEIKPEYLTDYIAEKMLDYNIEKIAVDNYRYTLLSDALKKIGFDAKEHKNIYLVRPSDIMKIVPVIDSCFLNHYFTWGDNPCLRWATNNTKLVPSGKKDGTDTGNYYYAKIEAKARKTDPFMALVHSMVIETGEDAGGSTYDNLDVIC